MLKLIYFYFSNNKRFYYLNFHLAAIQIVKDLAFSLRVLLVAKLKLESESIYNYWQCFV